MADIGMTCAGEAPEAGDQPADPAKGVHRRNRAEGDTGVKEGGLPVSYRHSSESWNLTACSYASEKKTRFQLSLE